MPRREYLSEAVLQDARIERRPYKMTDGKGLYILIQPNGSKYWRFDYRRDGRRFTMALGVYPDVTLAAAREAHQKAREQVQAGLDPIAEKRAAKLIASVSSSNSFGAVAEEVLAKLRREKKSPSTIKKRQWMLEAMAADLWNRPVDRITAPEVLAVLRKIEDQGKLETARRTRAAIGQVMRRAVATGRALHDPTPALRGEIATPTVTHRAAIIERQEAGRLMLAIGGYDRDKMRIGLMLLAYCFPRPGELRNARWSEVHMREKIWTVPEGRAKMRRAHRIPLSPQALALFEELKELTGDGELCFPSERANRAISDNSLNMALRTLGYGGEDHTAHGFRAMASSLLNEHSNFSPDAIELALGHKDTNAVRAAYHRAAHWKERQALMDWYGDFLDTQARKQGTIRRLVGPEPVD